MTSVCGNALTQQVAIVLATLIAGSFADNVFSPAMTQGILQPLFGQIFGTETGAGIAVLFEIFAVGMVLIGLGSDRLSTLKSLDYLTSIAPSNKDK